MMDEDQGTAFDDAMSACRVLLPLWQELRPGQMRDLANGLRWLAEHFEQANAVPVLPDYKIERLRDLHKRSDG
jgi:hypothetical protein